MEKQIILKTKLYPPPETFDLVERNSLYAELDRTGSLSVTLVCAPAGYGKSTLVASWLKRSGRTGSWLSLDERDNDLQVFLSYLIAAIRTNYPEFGKQSEVFLSMNEIPSVETLAESLINELISLGDRLELVLDDYHNINNRSVHYLVELLTRYPLGSFHLILLSRTSPLLPLPSLRAKNYILEIRLKSLLFSLEESSLFIDNAVNQPLNPSAVKKLHKSTEGWPVGLRLACVVVREMDDAETFINEFSGQSQSIQEFISSEIVANLPPDLRRWAMKMAVLKRFCSPLCDILCDDDKNESGDKLNGKRFLRVLKEKGIPIVSLDEHDHWYRYHHLFQQIMLYHLEQQYSPKEINKLHFRAAGWFEKAHFLEEGLSHLLAAGDVEEAGHLILRQRHWITEKEQWTRLESLLGQLPKAFIDQNPELLILKAWAYDSRGRLTELFQILDQVESILPNTKKTKYQEKLSGEIDALRGMQFYMDGDGEAARRSSRNALAKLPEDYKAERAFAIIVKAMSLQMTGNLARSLELTNTALKQPMFRDNLYHGRLLLVLCFMHWIDADLKRLKEVSTTMLEVGQENDLPQTIAFANYFIGISHYQKNDLIEAQIWLERGASTDSVVDINCFMRSSQALAFTYQALGDNHKAMETVNRTVSWLLKNAGHDYIPMMLALEAELALREDRLPDAEKWLQNSTPNVPKMAHGFFLPELVVVKILIQQGVPESYEKAASLLTEYLCYFESTYNILYQIKTLWLQAALYQRQGNEPAAYDYLVRALKLAQPGEMIRLFLSFGSETFSLLPALHKDAQVGHHARLVSDAFRSSAERSAPFNITPPSIPIIEESVTGLLSARELEVLGYLEQRYSNKQIGKKLFISPKTVQRHTENIYKKLQVSNRQEAVTKAYLQKSL